MVFCFYFILDDVRHVFRHTNRTRLLLLSRTYNTSSAVERSDVRVCWSQPEQRSSSNSTMAVLFCCCCFSSFVRFLSLFYFRCFRCCCCCFFFFHFRFGVARRLPLLFFFFFCLFYTYMRATFDFRIMWSVYAPRRTVLCCALLCRVHMKRKICV